MQIEASVKNIIFDFGGVLLNIDYKLTEKAFIELGLTDFSKLYSQATQKEVFDFLEKGLITPADFRIEVRKLISQEVSDGQIDQAWNAMLLDLPEERINWISNLKKSHRLFLLSNTNEIHFKAFSAYMQNKFNRDIFPDLFHKTYFSHQVKMRKPDAEIFSLVLNEQNLRKEETLFIDDSIQHIESAKKMGINTLFLEKGKDICSLSFEGGRKE